MMIRPWISRTITALVLALLAVPGGLRAQSVPLSVGEDPSGSLSTGDTLSYAFEAGEGFVLHGEADQISVDVVVTLLHADGQELGRWYGPARGAEAFTSSLREAGEYTLRVMPFEDEEEDFEIRLLELEARSEELERLADQLMDPYARRVAPGAPSGSRGLARRSSRRATASPT